VGAGGAALLEKKQNIKPRTLPSPPPPPPPHFNNRKMARFGVRTNSSLI